MSLPPRPYSVRRRRYPPATRRGPTFIPRAPVPGAVGAGLGAGAAAGGLAGLIGGLAIPILCLGCLSTLAILGLFATMIGATSYMNAIQQQLRKNIQGAGTMIEANLMVLFCALICSIYVLSKHRRGVAST
ncbi:unnamed protein product [Rotaria sp. Silwood2]|nr:unnamed protein product [Rotaria sp. Silwood2]CAF2733600.1 unnamed protein product [Rotaria sp. Silwood2]CAF3007628.1 unnamed protein product [Rotaria sp. Silwood2]CAF3149501.1 unnamed protein product [Rotaria sp. Silwood2]CAF3915006.1 unnamed protein product [Rotaria sp. Silwood2]